MMVLVTDRFIVKWLRMNILPCVLTTVHCVFLSNCISPHLLHSCASHGHSFQHSLYSSHSGFGHGPSFGELVAKQSIADDEAIAHAAAQPVVVPTHLSLYRCDQPAALE